MIALCQTRQFKNKYNDDICWRISFYILHKVVIKLCCTKTIHSCETINFKYIHQIIEF